MTDHRSGRPPTKPTVNGIPALPGRVHGLDSPHIELLAMLSVGGGTLTTLETREVCAAVVAYIEKLREASPNRNPRDRPC